MKRGVVEVRPCRLVIVHLMGVVWSLLSLFLLCGNGSFLLLHHRLHIDSFLLNRRGWVYQLRQHGLKHLSSCALRPGRLTA